MYFSISVNTILPEMSVDTEQVTTATISSNCPMPVILGVCCLLLSVGTHK